MFANVVPLAVRAVAVIACLVIGEADTLGSVAVERTTLLGYRVGGAGGQVWEADDAARALAYEASQAALAEQPALPGLEVATPRATPRLHPDVKHAPYRRLGGRVVEVWRAGDAAEARYQDLYASEVKYDLRRATAKGIGLDRRSEVEFDYPHGIAVPAIEVVS